jgi:hypothetical protein
MAGANISPSIASTAMKANELKYANQKLVGNYLRMGYDPNGSWRIYKLRPGLQSGGQGAGGRRYHRLHRAAAREPE